MKGQYITPAITIFNEDGSLDCKGNQNLYDHLINGGVDGIVIMGSIGEFFSMTMNQKKELIDIATTHINNRTRLLVGASSMSVDESIELCNYAYEKGAKEVLIVSPYYFPLSQESVESYYDKIAENTKINILLYSFPDRTGYDISPEVTLRLARKHKNIVGYKDTISGMNHTRELIKVMSKEFPNFEIFSGFDENFAHNVLAGGAGCIGGISNVIPSVCSKWVEAINKKDLEEVSKIQKIIDNMMEIYNITTPFISTIKTAVKLLGVGVDDYVTKPFMKANDIEVERIKNFLNTNGII